MRVVSAPVILVLCLGTAAVLGVQYALIVPFGEKPDEPSHMARALYEARYRRTPEVWTSSVFPSIVTYEAVQPPGYYVAAAHLLRLLPPVLWTVVPNPYHGCLERSRRFVLQDAGDVPPQVRILRLAGLSFVLVSGLLVFQAAIAFGVSPVTGTVASALAMMTPQVLFVSTGVSNDGMALAVGSLILWTAVRAAARGRGAYAFAAGVLAVASIAVKVSLAPYLVGVPLILWGVSGRRRWRTLGMFTLGGLALCVPALLLAPAPPGDQRGIVERLTLPAASVAWKDYLAFVQGMCATYWARFGWMDVEAPTSVHIVWGGILILATVGWILKGHTDARWIPLWLLLAVAALAWMGTLRSSHQIQGRFLFPYAGVVALIVAQGITLLSPRILPALTMLGIVAANVVSIAALVALYRPPDVPDDMIIDAHQCEADRVVLETLSSGTEIGQTFVGLRPGLCAVDVVFSGVAGDSGIVRLAVSDARTGFVFRTAELPCALIRPERWTRFRFAPIMKSGGRLLRLAFSAHGADTLGTLSLRFALGDPYLEGERFVAGVRRDGDLRFVGWVLREKEEEQ